MKTQKTYRNTKRLLKAGQTSEAYRLVLAAVTREIERRWAFGPSYYRFQDMTERS